MDGVGGGKSNQGVDREKERDGKGRTRTVENNTTQAAQQKMG